MGRDTILITITITITTRHDIDVDIDIYAPPSHRGRPAPRPLHRDQPCRPTLPELAKNPPERSSQLSQRPYLLHKRPRRTKKPTNEAKGPNYRTSRNGIERNNATTHPTQHRILSSGLEGHWPFGTGKSPSGLASPRRAQPQRPGAQSAYWGTAAPGTALGGKFKGGGSAGWYGFGRARALSHLC